MSSTPRPITQFCRSSVSNVCNYKFSFTTRAATFCRHGNIFKFPYLKVFDHIPSHLMFYRHWVKSRSEEQFYYGHKEEYENHLRMHESEMRLKYDFASAREDEKRGGEKQLYWLAKTAKTISKWMRICATSAKGYNNVLL